MSKQIKTDVEITYKKRNKTTVFWRGILVFPVAVFIGSFAVNANWAWASGFIILPALLSLVFREVYPSYLLTFNHALLELQTRVIAYALLLTDDYPSIERNKDIAGSTQYDDWFTSAVARDNIFATQFHPEKSAEYGLKLYKNFVSWHP